MTSLSDNPPESASSELESRMAMVPRGEGPTVLWLVAAIAAVAALVSRAVEPALPGIWVDTDHLITAVKLGGAVTSQLFAVASTAVVIGLVLATTSSSRPAYLRAFSVGAGVLTILAVMIASAVRLPEGSRVVLAATTALLALMCVRSTMQLYNLRAVSLLVACVGFAGLVRVATMLTVGLTTDTESGLVVVAARSTATLSSLLEIVAVLVAVAWLITQPKVGRDGTPRKMARPRFILLASLLFLSGLLTWLVSAGQDPDATPVMVLVSRSAFGLLTAPAPFVPDLVRVFVELLRWGALVTLLALRPRGPMMASSVAFGLIASGSLEIPLCAASLVVAALALTVHPTHGLASQLSAAAKSP